MTDKQKYQQIIDEINHFRYYVGLDLGPNQDTVHLDTRLRAMKLRIKKIVLDL